MRTRHCTLSLVELGNGCPALTASAGTLLAEAAAVCLEGAGHGQGAELRTRGDYRVVFVLHWPPVTEQMQRCYNDTDEATEWGACGVAIMAIRTLTGLTVVQRSRKGTGFDYWIGSEQSEMPFQDMARLEVTGMRSASESLIACRVRTKIRQTKQSDSLGLPAFVVVVEFSRPVARVVKR